jgi:transcriptional regulator with XRE-family HTH domain
MDAHHHNPSQLSRLSGVPQPTIYRFLAGTIKSPHSDTLKRLAAVYGVSESQLRGNAPLNAAGMTEHQQMGLSDMEQLLIRAYRIAPPEGKLTLIEIAHRALASYGYRSRPGPTLPTLPD